MRTYLAGPMRGIVRMNFPAFDAAAADLRRHGITVVSPAELDRAAGFDPINLPADWDWQTLPEDFALRHAAARDLAAILTCDAIHLLPGWQDSVGARAEKAVAEWIGLGVFEYGEPELTPARRNLAEDFKSNGCCERCRSEAGALRMVMIVCPQCGNKRCPKADWHGFKCSGSNATNQTGEPCN